jgi:hypothetical protein
MALTMAVNSVSESVTYACRFGVDGQSVRRQHIRLFLGVAQRGHKRCELQWWRELHRHFDNIRCCQHSESDLVDGVTWNGTPLNDATCGLKAVIVPLAGTVSGRTWNMTQKHSWPCIKNTVQVDRTIVVQLAR